MTGGTYQKVRESKEALVVTSKARTTQTWNISRKWIIFLIDSTYKN